MAAAIVRVAGWDKSGGSGVIRRYVFATPGWGRLYV